MPCESTDMMSITTLFLTDKSGKQPKCLAAVKQVDNLQCIHLPKYGRAMTLTEQQLRVT